MARGMEKGSHTLFNTFYLSWQCKMKAVLNKEELWGCEVVFFLNFYICLPPGSAHESPIYHVSLTPAFLGEGLGPWTGFQGNTRPPAFLEGHPYTGVACMSNHPMVIAGCWRRPKVLTTISLRLEQRQSAQLPAATESYPRWSKNFDSSCPQRWFQSRNVVQRWAVSIVW